MVENVWEFQWKIGIMIEEKTKCLQLQQEADNFFMIEFAKMGYKGAQLAALHQCRNYQLL
eukprot:7828901-Ditylum_brightwellii.AAC.1